LCPGAPATDLSAAAETSSAGRTSGEAPRGAPEGGRGWLGGLFDQTFKRTGWWLPMLALAALVVALVTLVGFAVADWRSFRRHGARRRAYRRRRSAFERLGQAPVQPAPARATRESRATAHTGTTVRQAPPAPPDDDDALLRRLLEE
jgi:hypothetical protein